MIFAKTLFVNTNTTPKKTGTITSTEYIPPKTTTTSEEPQKTSKKSKKTTEPDEDPYDGDKDDNGDAVGGRSSMGQFISTHSLHRAVKIFSLSHRERPATCRNENGWYMLNMTQACVTLRDILLDTTTVMCFTIS